MLRELWRHRSTKRLAEHCNEVGSQRRWATLDAFEHEDWFDEDYEMTIDHFLLCRIRTTGFISRIFDFEGVKYEVYDVGGVRGSRRRWPEYFGKDSSCLLFTVSLISLDA
eukprot:GABV01007825.1.p1 GENE.GABV01007825.1~~GABV01007825.1.p1  ORF type:complete len:110 (-),score=16.87 GABV01007825.1:3-332(-)